MIQNKKFKVKKIVYYSSEKHWGVLASLPYPEGSLNDLAVNIFNPKGDVSIVGNFREVTEGSVIEVSGNIVDSNFGKQIQIKTISVIPEEIKSKEGIINFLAKSAIKGISLQNAKKIYEHFKEDSIRVVLQEPRKLQEIFGIGSKTMEKVEESTHKYRGQRKFIEFCTRLGLQYRTISKIINALGEEALDHVKKDLFKLLELVPDLTFKEVDEVYISNGGDPFARPRLAAALLSTLKNLVMLEGSTGYPSSSLENRFYKVLNISNIYNSYEKIVTKLEDEEKIEVDRNRETGGISGNIYYKEYVTLEKNIADKIRFLQAYGSRKLRSTEQIIREELTDFPFKLNKAQVDAVLGCLGSPVSILTGCAGSGKSSITKALTNIYSRSGYNVVLLAPTAKACRRLEECVGEGWVASTIHRFLGATGQNTFRDQTPLDNTVVIIDEASMVDIILFNALLLRCSMTTRILLVGDNNQLPSVQAGNVLGDLMTYLRIHVSRLTDVVRQGENSSIIKYCDLINKGEIIGCAELSDFHYEEFEYHDELKKFFLKKYLKEVELHGLTEVQVICPYKNGELGMYVMNKLIQEKYNGEAEVLLEPYKKGDKVRHTRNDYKKEIFNGDVGIVGDLSEEESLTVYYSNKSIEYDSRDIEDLTLSYASTVHASQGSEYKVVFVLLDDSSANDFLLTRRMLYTAVSRGKKKVYLLSNPYLVDKCITNVNYRPRITKLSKFLREGSPYA